jgi:hypothetical protein
MDLFGSSVALSADGDWLAIGAPGEDSGASGIDGDQNDNSKSESGAVYVFHWDGSRYALASYVKSPAPDSGDAFGTSVAISGDGKVLAVGVPGDDGNGTSFGGDPINNLTPDSGAVFIYQRTDATWMQVHYLKAPAAFAMGKLGTSVALSEDGGYVGAGQPGKHEAYRYQFAPSRTIYASIPQNAVDADNVGVAVALSGDGMTLFSGAPLEDGAGKELNGNSADNTAVDAGAVFTMFENGAQHGYCKASNTESGDLFGSSISASSGSERFVVGAPGEDSGVIGADGNASDNSAVDAGAVYVFTRAGTTGPWMFSSYVKASNTSPGDKFGASVAMTTEGSYFVVGAPGEASANADDDRNEDAPGAGALYVFKRTPAEWSLQEYLKAPNISAGDALGTSVAISGDHAVVAGGAPGQANSAGAVYVFR